MVVPLLFVAAIKEAQDVLPSEQDLDAEYSHHRGEQKRVPSDLAP
jgi:hypothetical protein